ncbi:hypothetical protein SLS62_010722 [Diatrype stigma]|uniref:Uncharacterized protein n=1 Tax=Diatrype stigma TaxID=117547 RepID=A0AAN9U818_9PEZI
MASPSPSPSPSKYNKLAGKNILVVGGTTGIGFCVAEGCIEHGARRVTITGASAASASRAVERLRAAYPSAPADSIAGHACDLSSSHSSDAEANAERVLRQATANGTEKLDHIAFLAGDASGGATPIAELDARAALPPLLAVRVYGALAFAKLAPRYVEMSAASSLALTAGALPDKPLAGRSAVAGVGGAIVALGRSLAVDLAPVRVNVVSPGLVHTERFERMFPVDAEGLEGFLGMAKNNTLVKEVGRPEDTAEAYLYVMKDRFTTGEHIRSNGGVLLV